MVVGIDQARGDQPSTRIDDPRSLRWGLLRATYGMNAVFFDGDPATGNFPVLIKVQMGITNQNINHYSTILFQFPPRTDGGNRRIGMLETRILNQSLLHCYLQKLFKCFFEHAIIIRACPYV